MTAAEGFRARGSGSGNAPRRRPPCYYPTIGEGRTLEGAHPSGTGDALEEQMEARSTHPRRAVTRAIMFAALVGALALVIVGPAFAADGVRVMPTPAASPYTGQNEADISGNIAAFASNDPANGDDAVISLKYLPDDSAPWSIARPPGFKDMAPTILVDSGTIYVVWTRLTLSDPWDSDLWIWKGAYDAPSSEFVASDDSYPKPLVSGSEVGAAPTQQAAPSLGLARTPGGDDVVLAWEDDRDNGPYAPLVYFMDLTADTAFDDPAWVESDGPATAGSAVDQTDVLARGQLAPDVGLGGIYWLDDRWSFWNDGLLTDTAVWHANLNSSPFTVGPLFADTDHTYDNGANGGPKVTWNGAMWLRSGPYGGSFVSRPYVKPAGGSGYTMGPAIQPFEPDTYTWPGASTSGVVLDAAHLDRTDAADSDIFFFNAATGQRIPVCDQGNLPGTDPESHPDYFKKQQTSPTIGPAPGGYRVIWSDMRDAQPGSSEDTPDATLYEAFVSTISARARYTTVIHGATARIGVTVSPDFGGTTVDLQLVKAVRAHGATTYKVVKKLSSAKLVSAKAVVLGAPSSTATLSWKTKLKGNYLLRVWFPGGTRYSYDGATLAGGKIVGVPHVPNVSNVVRVRVK
jgi:hypothetical protein